MGRVLMMSSWVSVGHVGLSATVPVLQALGHRVTQLPTTVLSNHPGWPHVAGASVPPQQIAEMLDAIDTNGWLDGHDAVLIGYLPSPEHVSVACEVVRRVKQCAPGARIVVDPILGDEPKGLYVPENAAIAIRETLVPVADVLTPNRFELGWLTGMPAATLENVWHAAQALIAGSSASEVFVTSPPVGAGETGILAASPGEVRLFRTPVREHVPNGVGDVFSALIAAGLPVGAALGHLLALIDASTGAQHLDIVGAADRWTRAGAIGCDPDLIPSEA
ncbi:MAG: pyridoxal kinase [Paracoccaceae bacterium]|jgi:pyridoxine kinase